MFNWQTIPAL